MQAAARGRERGMTTRLGWWCHCLPARRKKEPRYGVMSSTMTVALCNTACAIEPRNRPRSHTPNNGRWLALDEAYLNTSREVT